ncbi:MAG: hypothetical protein J6P61_07950 [Erysipelotrichaceae bacterium]|nr:hypothetical protein [Erysipelotrichaceae bacterium]
MFSTSMICLAFLAGCMGTLLGGTFSFITYGVLGALGVAASFSGVDMTWYNTVAMGVFFVPAVMFNAAVLATPVAALRYDIKGHEIVKSLALTHDFLIVLVGGIGGVIGYTCLTLIGKLGINCDQGALTIVITGIIYRLIFNRGQKYSRDGLRLVKRGGLPFWGYEIVLGVVIAAVAAYFVEITGNVSIGFYMSAIVLLLQFIDPYVPCTHQISMVAGYAMGATHSFAIAIVFGVIAELINTIFGLVLNNDNGTHIDPPAVAIATCSLIIFALFG